MFRNVTNPVSQRLPWAVGAVAAAFFVLASKNDVYSDFQQHAQFAELLLKGVERPPHFLYHLFVIGLEELTPLSFLTAGWIVVGIALLLTFVLVSNYFRDGLEWLHPGLNLVFCNALLLMHAIPLFFLFDKHLYYGYLTSNTFHNPTSIFLKPVAVLHFLLFTKMIEEGSQSIKKILVLALLVSISVFIKPSYAMTLVPAATLILLLGTIKKRDNIVPVGLVIFFGLVLPGLGIIGWQFLQTFSSSPLEVTRWTRGAISFAPLELFRSHSHPWSFLPKLLGSLAFPLSVAAFHLKEIQSNTCLRLAWLNMLIATIVNFCLIDRVCFQCGDFGWSSQIALFLLNCVSLKTWLKGYQSTRFQIEKPCSQLVFVLPITMLTLHVLSGFIWYLSNAVPNRFYP